MTGFRESDSAWRARYEATMQRGEAEYSDVLHRLGELGLASKFIQTGGMNAAIQANICGDIHLLITDEDDSLSWAREEHLGWAVGLYLQEERADASRFETSDDGSVDALVGLIDKVLRPE